VDLVTSAGADWLHIDVMDGCFVPNITFGIPLVQALRPITKLPLDVHLMIVEPERHIEAFAKAGADAITVHAETCSHLEQTLAQIQQAGCRAGVALNPSTNIDVLRYVRHRLDLVLIMTVNPGFSGQKLISEILPKIGELKKWLGNEIKTVDIVVDGGVNKTTAASVIRAGADVVVAGSGIFGFPPDTYNEQIRAIRESVN
jgi:ribulose-phosphate 3-epimerase